MMSLRIVNLYINAYGGPGAPLLRDLHDNQPADPQIWVLRDKFKLRLWFRQVVSSSQQQPVQIDAGAALIVGGRAVEDIDADSSIFSASGFTEHHCSHGWYYEAVLDLNRTELIAAFQPGDYEVRCLVDIKNEAGDASELITLPQFVAIVRQAGYRTTDIPSTAGDLPYPAPESLAAKTVAGKYRFKDDGTFQLWNSDQSLFFSLSVRGTLGAEVIHISDTGEA